MKQQNFRVLARELAVEEIELVSGALTGPGDDGQSDQMGDQGSGCTNSDESWFTVGDGNEDARRAF